MTATLLPAAASFSTRTSSAFSQEIFSPLSMGAVIRLGLFLTWTPLAHRGQMPPPDRGLSTLPSVPKASPATVRTLTAQPDSHILDTVAVALSSPYFSLGIQGQFCVQMDTSSRAVPDRRCEKDTDGGAHTHLNKSSACYAHYQSPFTYGRCSMRWAVPRGHGTVHISTSSWSSCCSRKGRSAGRPAGCRSC